MGDVTTYRLTCSPACSLGPLTRWGPRATEMLVQRVPVHKIIAIAVEDGYPMVESTLSRHRKHIVLVDVESEEGPPVANIEILQEIIRKGFANKKNWKPTINDTMKAMDMWFKLTSGNPFDELLDALASAAIGEENPEAKSEKVDVEESFDEEDDDVDGGDGRTYRSGPEALPATYQSRPGEGDVKVARIG